MNDMETKQIINWLRDKADRADNPSWTRMMHKAADRLKELDQAQNWIPVAERLPEPCTEVLLWDDLDGGKFLGYLDSKNNWKIPEYSNGFDWDITHWMPLPEPPGR